MQLGSYQFQLSTAAYQEFARSSAWTWAAQARFGQDDALQFTGRGEDTISLPGTIFPEFRGGLGQIDAMRAEADLGQLLPLIDGLGRMMGDWAILQVDERSTVFIADGIPLKMEFTIKLRRGPLQLGQGLIDAVLSDIVPTSSMSLANQAGAAAASAANGAGGLIGQMSASLAAVSGFAGALGAQASNILGAVRSGISATKLLQNAGGDAASLLKGIKSPADIASAMNGLVNVSGGVSRSLGTAGSILKAVGVDLTASGTNPAAVKAVQDSMININRANVLAVSVRSTGAGIVKTVASDAALASAEAGLIPPEVGV